MTKRLFIFLIAIVAAYAQNAPWATTSGFFPASSNVSTSFDSKLNWQTSTVGCADKSGTVGKDLCMDTGTFKVYKVTVTGASPTPATWADVLSGTAANTVEVNGATVPASQSCVGTNGSSQIVSATCGAATVPYTWSIVNGAILANNPSMPFVGVSIPYNSSTNWRFVTRALTIPYALQASITCQQPNAAVNASACGFYLTDGTKAEGLECLHISTGSGACSLRVETMANVTTDTASVAGPTGNLVGDANFEVKIVNDSSHRTFYYYSNGAWVPFYQENSGTFLTESAIGVGGVNLAGSVAAYVGLTLTFWSGI
jgi:hypothetical protein